MRSPARRILLSCVTWCTVRFARRPLRLFRASHFRRDLLCYDLPSFQLVIGNSREAVQRVLARGADRYRKSRVMTPLLSPLIGRGLFASEDADVPGIRRMFVRAIAQVDERMIVSVCARLLDEYRSRWRREGILARLPVSAEMSRLAVDIVSECLFRTRFAPAESARFTRLFFLYQRLSSPLRLFPWIGRSVFAPLLRRRQRRVAVAMRQLIRDRFLGPLRESSSPAASAPFALAVVERERAGERPLDDERLLDEVAVMLLAGHETSASALSWLLLELARDTALQHRLRQEPERGGDATSLQRSLINEVLRLYPPIPICARDATAAESIADRHIRAGALVLIAPWVIHRHAGLWDDPLRFDPDRFRLSPAADASGRFLPFGAGPRACPGSRFAMTEMQAIVSGIVRSFNLRPLAGRAAQPLGNLTTRPDREVHIALEPLIGCHPERSEGQPGARHWSGALPATPTFPGSGCG